jgi:hypothetical protein
VTDPGPSTSPSEWLAVAGSSLRAVASLAAGSGRRATIIASTSLSLKREWLIILAEIRARLSHSGSGAAAVFIQ